MRDQRMQTIMAIGILLVVGVALMLLFFREAPPSNKELVSLALGVMLGAVKDVFSYYFNATQSSDRKDMMIENALLATPTVNIEPASPGTTQTVSEGPPVTVTTTATEEPQ